MKTSKALIKARKLIAQGWTQGSGARDKKGRHVSVYSSKAVCWCVQGAVFKASPTQDVILAATSYLNRLIDDSICVSVIKYNDTNIKSQDEALTWLSDAIGIALAEEEFDK